MMVEKPDWPDGYWESFGPVGEDFAAPGPFPPAPRRGWLEPGLDCADGAVASAPDSWPSSGTEPE